MQVVVLAAHGDFSLEQRAYEPDVAIDNHYSEIRSQDCEFAPKTMSGIHRTRVRLAQGGRCGQARRGPHVAAVGVRGFSPDRLGSGAQEWPD